MSDLLSKLPRLGGKPRRKKPEGRFVILGLPRSGSTYLMTLLNSHSGVFCTGEQFNPHAVVGIETEDKSSDAVVTRDRDPLAHFRAVFEKVEARGAAQAGFKYMLGHNIAVLKALAADPDLRIFYVWRENRLAQVASMIKAERSQRWAQTERDEHLSEKIMARPRYIARRWHEFATTDYLASCWLESIPNPVMTLEYRMLFASDIEARLCSFLELEPDPAMASPLIKQGANRVIDRFETPGPIAHYFTEIGRAEWLGEEL